MKAANDNPGHTIAITVTMELPEPIRHASRAAVSSSTS